MIGHRLRKTMKITIELNSANQEEYREMVDWLTNRDMFRNDIIGYWARGFAYSERLGWLIRTDEENPTEDEIKKVLKIWRDGGELPEEYYRLDKAAAEKAVQIGIKNMGLGFIQGDSDGNDIDVALQEAILGRVIYC